MAHFHAGDRTLLHLLPLAIFPGLSLLRFRARAARHLGGKPPGYCAREGIAGPAGLGAQPREAGQPFYAARQTHRPGGSPGALGSTSITGPFAR